MTWNIADLNSGSPPLPETPQRLAATLSEKRSLNTPVQKRRTYSKDLEAELSSHVHHFSPNSGLELPPVESSRQLSSSPNPSTSKRSRAKGERLERHQGSLGPARKEATKMRSAGSMQTPPPTSTSASKRKAKQAQVAKLVQDSASRVRKLSSPAIAQSTNPEPNNDFVQPSPQFFPGLEFSPDVFEFPSAGPATAPVYPQQKLFWDPDTSIGPMDMDFSGGGLDMFESNPTFDLSHYVSAEAALEPVPAMSTFCMGSDEQNAVAHTTHSFTANTSVPEMSAYPTSTAHVSRKKFAAQPTTVDHAVDPCLLLSTHGLQGPSQNMGTSMSKPAREIRQPYLHQMQESRREKEVDRSRRSRSRHTSHTSSSQATEPKQEKRPRLNRRSTDTLLGKGGSISRKHSQGPSYHRPKVEKERDNGHLQRKLSPIKSQPFDISSATVEHPRLRPQTSVTFTIDDNGRARTETKLTRDESESETDQEPERTDRRTWGDSASESSEEADADIATSFYSSFTFPSSKQPKLARFSTDSISHSKKSSYSSTYTSSRSEHTMSDRGPALESRHRSSLGSRGTNFSGIQIPHGAGSLSSGIKSEFGPSTAGDLASEAETVVDSDQAKGDAQHALKRVMKDRARNKRTEKSSLSSSKPREKPRRQALRPTKYQAHSSSSRQPVLTTPTKLQPHTVYDPTYNISPTTITDPDLTSPSTDRGSSASDNTRCVCLTSESGGHLMIQWYEHFSIRLRATELTSLVIHARNGCTSDASVSLQNGSPRYTSAFTARDILLM